MTDEELDAIEQISTLGGGLDITTQRTLCAELRATRAERDAEREACAQIADAEAAGEGAFSRNTAAERIAAAIRARSDHHPSHPPDQI